MLSVAIRIENWLLILAGLAFLILAFVNWRNHGQPGWWMLLLPVAAWLVLGQLTTWLGLKAADRRRER